MSTMNGKGRMAWQQLKHLYEEQMTRRTDLLNNVICVDI